MKALDTYVEIVTSAKDRAEKAAEYGELEKDETLLQTLSEAVFILCCFGSSREAERANELTVLLKKYTRKHVPRKSNGVKADNNETEPERTAIDPSVLAMVYRAIGIGLANWASWTPISEARDNIRADAIQYLERSIGPELGDVFNCSSIYTLSLLLAENRDLNCAIGYVKSVLAENGQFAGSSQPALTRQRDLVSLWHLLALLLSAKEEFELAKQSCEAAFEQFPTALSSFVPNDKGATTQQSASTFNSSGLQHTLVDQLQDREKERIIETRMTQLAFVELLEGPETALNHGKKLVELFRTLFPDLAKDRVKEKDTVDEKIQTPSALPKSPTGTTRSKRDSVFGGRQKGGRERSSSPVSAQSDRRSFAVPAEEKTDKHMNGETANHTGVVEAIDSLQQQNVDGGSEGVASAKQTLPPVPHNMKGSQKPAPIGHSQQPPEQDVRLPLPVSYRFYSPTGAVTQFPVGQSQKSALGIMVKIWLFIAGLYRRAFLFEDAQEACEEATVEVKRVEAISASHEASARSLTSRGWGGRRSSEELRADIYAEQGFLAKALSRPFEAINLFEEALVRYPDHPKATIGLANLQLDIWDEKLSREPEQQLSLGLDFSPFLADALKRDRERQSAEKPTSQRGSGNPSAQTGDDEAKLLNRLAARERAYGLMSALTKLGSSWDNSDAWYTLGRAYEAGGQVEKLKEVLWWCIELEDRRPVRHWSNIGSGLYVL